MLDTRFLRTLRREGQAAFVYHNAESEEVVPNFLNQILGRELLGASLLDFQFVIFCLGRFIPLLQSFLTARLAVGLTRYFLRLRPEFCPTLFGGFGIFSLSRRRTVLVS
jgi:hypothetical protein